ncbi:MAG TPA: BamA/TamA family outer membrane protein [Candidatus Latescibacteria bacterium]|nr:hypothetical protein [Gemmatimonadaceae bacterium]MDP6016760.1 BamA/TamA family outer membrane protein [Candidatus Latescibacterota bacterium]HJP31124.1 BamA/TamA family outer membrane protein [Candidatus Latescibacterota bacterium]
MRSVPSRHSLPAILVVLALVATPIWSQHGTATDTSSVDSTAQRRDRGLGRTILSGASAVADPLSATEGTVDAVKWKAKRKQITLAGTPYGVTGLPVVYYSPGTGWNYGTRVQIADYSRRPYRYKLTLHSVSSSEGKRNAHLRLKVPHLSGTGFGLNLIASNRRDIRARYYGLSNDSDNDRDLVDPDHVDFIDEDYYHYILEKPRLFVSLLRHVYGPVTMSFDLGLERTDVDRTGAQSFYLDVGTPDGVVDGVTGFIGAALSWDTRDDPTIPRRGVFHEWSYETSRNSLLSLFFEEIDFQRYTFTDARYWPRSKRLNIAHRTIVEALRGAVPLFAYGEIGGSRRIKGLGGSDTLRGFDRQRFTDNVRVLTNTEARYHLGTGVAFKQHLELHGVLFVDTGQVQPGFNEMRPQDVHVTAGWGLRTYWNADFVLRADLGLSSEQVYTTVKLRNLF